MQSAMTRYNQVRKATTHLALSPNALWRSFVYISNLRNKASGFGLLLLLASSLVTPSHAQQYLGTLNGSVADATGAKVVGAEVTATDTTTHFVSKGVTNGEGEYAIPFLTPDVYTITVTANGFRVETRTDRKSVV